MSHNYLEDGEKWALKPGQNLSDTVWFLPEEVQQSEVMPDQTRIMRVFKDNKSVLWIRQGNQSVFLDKNIIEHLPAIVDRWKVE